MYTLFDRSPFTEWKIVLVDRYIDKTFEEIAVDEPTCSDYCEFTCFYRTTFKDNKSCEEFTMFHKEIGSELLSLYIFKNGDTILNSLMPVSVDIDKRKKRIAIQPLVYCSVDDNIIGFTFIDDIP